MRVVARIQAGRVGVAMTLLCAIPALGDVTMEQRMRVDGEGLMQMINMSGDMVTTIAGDRARTDSNLQMESRLMRMFGGGGATTEIIRLDEEKVYLLNPKKKTYTETTFEEQRAAMEKSIAQMREAQGSQQQGATGVNEESCEWSEPTATTERSGEIESIAGYDSEHLRVTASQSCADPKTGQVCSFNLILDQWLSPEFEAGDEVMAYYQAYAEKLGLEVAASASFAQRLESMFGSYEGIWKEIAARMEEVEGYPLRTTVALAVGGPQCQAQQAETADASPGVAEAVGGALGGTLGGLFGRRRDAAREKAEEQAPAPPASAVDPALPEGTMKLMAITTELVSLSNDAADPASFEVPDNFRKARR